MSSLSDVWTNTYTVGGGGGAGAVLFSLSFAMVVEKGRLLMGEDMMMIAISCYCRTKIQIKLVSTFAARIVEEELMKALHGKNSNSKFRFQHA
jgi:uncharacterized spore protein YtfJ